MNERMRMSENEIGGRNAERKERRKEWQKSKTKNRKKLIGTKASL